jgi:acetyl-CoA synthetase
MTSTDKVWAEATSHLSRDFATGLNTAVETCERWAGNRAKLALVIRHADGGRETWTYYELARESARLSEVLRRTGLVRGDRVAGVLSRQREAWLTSLAAWRAGIVYVPIFTGFGADAVAQRLSEGKVKTVVVDYQSREVVHAALSKISEDIAVISVAGPRGEGLHRGDWSYWSEVDRIVGTNEATPTGASEPATLMFTSGTTNTPKGCLIPHSGFVSLIPFVRGVLDLRPSDLLFSTSDPGWSYGLYTTGVVPMALGYPRLVYTGDFSPRDWLTVIAKEDASFVAGAPSAFRGLARYAARNGLAASVRGATCAGEALDDDTVNAWEALGQGPLLDGYGLTEVGMVLANLSNPPIAATPGTLAGPVPGFEVDLYDPEGRQVGEGGTGQIVVQRPPFQLSSGYDNEPDAWEARWRDDWFLTGDLGRRDESGRWHYVGREDDVIITSGYNVGPAEVESVLLQHSGVAEAAVVAQADPERGSVVRAVIVPSPGAPSEDVLTKQLQESVRLRVGRHAYPRVVDFVDSLPRTATGKIRRAALRNTSPPRSRP